jgi:hypothetical protein
MNIFVYGYVRFYVKMLVSFQINTRTKSVDSCRSLTLRQYALMHKEISEQVAQLSSTNLTTPRPNEITASAIFNE